MGRIHLLDQETAELIAAGEVIERPSSVVKELVENAIDAGASSIAVELKNGGVRYIRVTDDGGGIVREDVPKAFLRHATSKVSGKDDLYQIGTLGFRGEALASIGAVARVEMLTKTPDETLGTRYEMNGGVPGALEDAGCPNGTTIIVRDLFYNIPARMKFLKKDVTEGNAISGLLDRLALSHPEISFRLIKDGQRKLHTPGDGKLLSAIYAVYGSDFGSGLVPVSGQSAATLVEGYITKPEHAKGSRSMEHFFINGRYVKSLTMMAAMEDAYKNTIMTGKFPGCVLCLTIPRGMVDVNVHPAKLEVKLSDERLVYEGVLSACKAAIGALDQRTQTLEGGRGHQPRLSYMDITNKPLQGEQQRLTAAEYRRMEEGAPSSRPPQASSTPVYERGVARDPSGAMAQALYYGSGGGRKAAPQVSPPPRALPPPEQGSPVMTREPQQVEKPVLSVKKNESGWGDAVLVGEVFHTFLIAETGEEMLLIDKHAAHERILFERLKEEYRTGELPRQTLLAPLRLSLAKEQYGALLENLSAMEEAGFSLEDFGEGSVLVREIPAVLPAQLIEETVAEAAEALLAGKGRLELDFFDELFHSVACKAAIKGNDFTEPLEQEVLLKMLREDPTIRHCPHGRPIVIAMTRREIEKMFGRIQ